MNTVQAIFASLADAELKAIVQELQAFDASGVLPAGRVRDLAARLMRETGLSYSDAAHLSQKEPLRLAAYRWAAG